MKRFIRVLLYVLVAVVYLPLSVIFGLVEKY